MRSATRVMWRVAALTLASLLTACASVRIDVDVYKGPLANGANVQAMKVAELAVSSKLLLVTLRDELEWGNHTAEGKAIADSEEVFHAVMKGRKGAKAWWQSGYVAQDAGECAINKTRRCFEADRAARVNDVLCTLSSPGALATCPPASGVSGACRSIESQLSAMRGEGKSLMESPEWSCLRAGLVVFSEQILVFSNSEALNARRDWLQFDLRGSRNVSQARSDRYVALLQSLGNAIQVQLDDLEQRTAHEHQAKTGANTEWLALQAVPPPGAPPTSDETRADVIDRLIAQLRHELIQARKTRDTATANALEAALREAYDQRAAMIYLRPATSYLRSASAASLFQEDADLRVSRNLLVPDFLNPKNIPKFWDKNGDLREEIDKQFWSNINRVNVTGGGDTNYVIAKDDVGNWYVKGYSADPTSVFKSAQGLGLFALGGRMNTNLVSWLEQDRELKDELGKATDDTKKKNLRDQIQNLNKQRPAASNDALQGLYEKYRDNYVAALRDTERALDEFFRDSAAGSDGLRTKAKTAWDGKTSAVAAVNLTDEDFTVAFDESYATLGSKISVFLANHAEQTNGSPRPPASAKSLRERGAAAIALLNGLRAFSEAFGMKITAIEAETANRKAANLNVETSMAALKKARQLRDEAAGAAAASEHASKVLVDSTSLKALHDEAVKEKSRTESVLSTAQTDHDNAVANSRNRDKAVTAVVGAVQSVANGEARGVAMKLQKASSQFETALGFIEESAAGK